MNQKLKTAFMASIGPIIGTICLLILLKGCHYDRVDRPCELAEEVYGKETKRMQNDCWVKDDAGIYIRAHVFIDQMNHRNFLNATGR